MRDMMLVWGMRDAKQFYALDELAAITTAAPGLKLVLVAEEGTLADLPKGFRAVQGTAVDALAEDTILADRDIYAAGPPAMLRALSAELLNGFHVGSATRLAAIRRPERR